MSVITSTNPGGLPMEVYEGGPHGLADTHKERLNEDLLCFVKA